MAVQYKKGGERMSEIKMRQLAKISSGNIKIEDTKNNELYSGLIGIWGNSIPEYLLDKYVVCYDLMIDPGNNWADRYNSHILYVVSDDPTEGEDEW